jgi:hypothetical protein
MERLEAYLARFDQLVHLQGVTQAPFGACPPRPR